MIDWFKNTVFRKESPENENPNKIVNIAENIIDFNKLEKGKGIKILTPKQMFPRLPIGRA